jgi:asparagine synthase (glutamine-hydrolysing)
MCGIAGVWGNEHKEVVARMMKRMVHRGPDAKGMFNNGHGCLGHQRLSIMDPQGGNQPIYSGDGGRAIVANGEIYNFPNLRTDLKGKHKFRTSNDSESALHLYEDIAVKAADQLDGMFAFAISDGQELYAARDPIGIKPLYYGKYEGNFIFASELKALIDIAEDVREFPPGTWYHTKYGFNSFYVVPRHQQGNYSIEECCKMIRQKLENAVLKRLMSDVPVGAFLSGGLDSSLICAIARKHVDQLHTFSVGVEGSPDLKAARVVADHIDSIHHEYILTTEEVVDKLPDIIYYLESFDQDLVRSAIPCYFTSRLAADYVKVILTGEGADELFAGYTYYKDIDEHDDLHDELRRSVCSLHNINLQRVDRLTMAHSIEGRVPFLDTEMIDLAQKIPVRYKLKNDGDQEDVEKWILRKACEDLLPYDIVWRDKEQFDEGSGTVDIMTEAVTDIIKKTEANKWIEENNQDNIRSAEEAAYYKLLDEAYGGCSAIFNNVARWSERE